MNAIFFYDIKYSMLTTIYGWNSYNDVGQFKYFVVLLVYGYQALPVIVEKH